VVRPLQIPDETADANHEERYSDHNDSDEEEGHNCSGDLLPQLHHRPYKKGVKVKAKLGRLVYHGLSDICSKQAFTLRTIWL